MASDVIYSAGTDPFLGPILMVTDAAANRAYFLTQLFGSTTVTLQSFNLTTRAAIDFNHYQQHQRQHWTACSLGANGLAFNTSGNQVFLIAGTFVH